jgi:hypothetical protein
MELRRAMVIFHRTRFQIHCAFSASEITRLRGYNPGHKSFPAMNRRGDLWSTA